MYDIVNGIVVENLLFFVIPDPLSQPPMGWKVFLSVHPTELCLWL